MARRIAGTFAGIVVAMLIVGLMDGLGHMLFPKSVARSMRAEDLGAAIAAAPLAAKLIMACGWFLAALVGGLIALRLTQRRESGWIVAALILAACIYNGLSIPGVPLWMLIAGVLAPIVAGLIVARVSAGPPRT